MATRSNLIARIGKDYQVMYVYWEGDNHLEALEENYNDQKSVEELFSFRGPGILASKIKGSKTHSFKEPLKFQTEYEAVSNSFDGSFGVDYAYVWNGQYWKQVQDVQSYSGR